MSKVPLEDFSLSEHNNNVYKLYSPKHHMEGGFGRVYKEQGVSNYYEQSGQEYSNPHKYDIERLIRKKLGPRNPFIKRNDSILDLACGSGEVTAPLQQIGYTNLTGLDPYTF